MGLKGFREFRECRGYGAVVGKMRSFTAIYKGFVRVLQLFGSVPLEMEIGLGVLWLRVLFWVVALWGSRWWCFREVGWSFAVFEEVRLLCTMAFGLCDFRGDVNMAMSYH